MRKKKLPSLQFVNADRMSLISPLNSNDRSIPLMCELKNKVRMYGHFTYNIICSEDREQIRLVLTCM